MKLAWKNFCFDFTLRSYVMGILNVTPDSFSDGGTYFSKESAVEQALRMEDEGADIIDIGGESTRPGAEKISVKEEVNRVVPVIEALAGKVKVPISVDTYKSDVAKAAIQAGASIINDISGLRFDPEMPGIAAKNKVPVVIMHIKGTPRNMQKAPVYKALIPEIIDYLHEGIKIARDAGIPDDMIIIDPGIGFGKTVEHNLEIIKGLNEFTGFEKPVLLGHSRKSFIGRMLGDLPVSERLEGTAAAAAIGIFNGANIIRVHDVKEMAGVAKIADGIKRGFVNFSQ
ncbi:MAG TPA: dihydropteroate synthase [Nitrospirae bacterium]|nr:dihydropteroate synthase [bacterium BMS3Abin06]HDH11567.1 dihydropteroate synthase [Nitrospirota bacterium]HDZ01976.1 dihydropteroate synthase [Nitrospirota bacterium]